MSRSFHMAVSKERLEKNLNPQSMNSSQQPPLLKQGLVNGDAPGTAGAPWRLPAAPPALQCWRPPAGHQSMACFHA